MVSLNTLFILVFGMLELTTVYLERIFSSFCIFSYYFPAFCPYHIGHFSVVGLGFEEYVSMLNRFEIKVRYTSCYKDIFDFLLSLSISRIE